MFDTMLGKTTEYAIRALVYVYIQNQESKRPGFREIAKKINSPEQFTAKVLQNLVRNKLVSSIKGRGGGFYFDQASKPLILYEVICIIESENFFHKCVFGLTQCDCENPCPLHKDFSPVRELFFKLVKEVTIQSLAHNINERNAILTRS